MRSRMSIIPKLVSRMWEEMERPHRLMDQRFGQMIRPEQFLPSSVFDRFFDDVDRVDRRFPGSYYRPWADFLKDIESGSSIIQADKNKFQVDLDVQQFKPEEINVKVVDDYVVVEGKHEEKHDEHGTISRHFIRKYLIPEQCDAEKASGTISSDGVLSITAPLKPQANAQQNERVLKIEHVKKTDGQKKISSDQKKGEEQHHIDDQKIAQKQ